MKTEGTNLRRLTENGFVGKICWHPEGKSIVFAANGLLKYNFGTDSVSIINLNLENARPVEWSYDGQQLLFVMTEEFPKSAFYLFNNKINAIERISFDSRQIMGADWFTSFDNQN